jgi:hypothetical protein
MQNMNQKIKQEIERAADLAFDNSNNVDTLVQYSNDFIRRAWLYLSVEDADEYIDSLTTMISYLKCYQHGED